MQMRTFLRIEYAAVIAAVGLVSAAVVKKLPSAVLFYTEKAEASKVDFTEPFVAEFTTYNRSPLNGDTLHGSIVFARNRSGDWIKKETPDRRRPERFTGDWGSRATLSVTSLRWRPAGEYRTIRYIDKSSEFSAQAERLISRTDLSPSALCLKTADHKPIVGTLVGKRLIGDVTAFGVETFAGDSSTFPNASAANIGCLRTLGRIRVRRWHAPAYSCTVVLEEAYLVRSDGREELIKQTELKGFRQPVLSENEFIPPSEGELLQPKDYLSTVIQVDPKQQERLQSMMAAAQERYERSVNARKDQRQ